MDLGIKGKKVLVTGASQGIGREIALAFAEEDCKVAVISRRKDKLIELVKEMGGETKGHSYYVGDMLEEGKPRKAIESLTLEGGGFEIAVHNIGGTLNLKNPLASAEEWCKVWHNNVGIAIEMNALLVPQMQKNNWGRIIHISSISAESVRGSTPYAAAKAYLNAYVKGIGRSFAKDNIVVSAIMPGAIWEEGGHWDNIRKNKPEIEKDFLRHHHAIGRLGRAEEIAPFILFMASKWVTFAQAAIIPVDGGTM